MESSEEPPGKSLINLVIKKINIGKDSLQILKVSICKESFFNRRIKRNENFFKITVLY